MRRTIFHVDMDAFFVSVEQRLNPTLRGKPVIVGGDPEGRGVVSAASYEARAFGVHSAMPVSKAKRLCPQAICLRGNFDHYKRAHKKIMAILEKYTPDIEVTSIDEAYMDMTGFDRLYGHPMETAEKLKMQIQDETGLSASIGVASGKTLSKIVSDCAKPNGILMVLHDCERAFLAPLKISRLPGIGKHTQERMTDLGIRTIGQLAQIDEKMLVRTFGQWGHYLHLRACGIDESRLELPQAPKSISRERTFDEDTADPEQITSTLYFLVEKTARTLRGQKFQCRTITLKLRYSDFKTLTRSVTLKSPVDTDDVIFQNVKQLFTKADTRRGRIRLLGVGLSNFTSQQWQQELIDFHHIDRMKNLFKSIDQVRDRYGFDAVKIFKKPDGTKK
jgi:DNA polymerase IV